jgi:hypothetical protein
MRQYDTVTEYVDKFMSLLAHNDPLTTNQQVQLFMLGLTDLLRVDVEMQKLLDLQVAMSMARAYEQHTTIMATSSKENSSMAIGQPQGKSLKGYNSNWGRADTPAIDSHRDAERRDYA